MTDRDGELEGLAAAAKKGWGAVVLFQRTVLDAVVRRRVSPLFVREKFPKLARQYQEWYAKNGYAPDEYRKKMSERVAKVRRELGLCSRPWEERTRDGEAAAAFVGWLPGESVLRRRGRNSEAAAPRVHGRARQRAEKE